MAPVVSFSLFLPSPEVCNLVTITTWAQFVVVKNILEVLGRFRDSVNLPNFPKCSEGHSLINIVPLSFNFKIKQGWWKHFEERSLPSHKTDHAKSLLSPR